MPDNKKSSSEESKPESKPSGKNVSDSTLSDEQASRVKGGRINISSDPEEEDPLIP